MSLIISKRIKDLRLANGLSQEEVAFKLNMTKEKYSLIESNQSPITFREITEIAELYNISTNVLTKISEPKKDISVLFKENCIEQQSLEVIDKVQKIVEYMIANEKIYYKKKEESNSHG